MHGDGKRVVVACGAGGVLVWGISPLDATAFHAQDYDAVVSAVAVDPAGKRFATAAWDLTARLWDLETGEALRTFSGHRGWLEDVAFDHAGTRLATAV